MTPQGGTDGPERDSDEFHGLCYRGTLIRFALATGLGAVRSQTGREIPFDIRFVTLPRPGGAEEMREGMAVGFDVSWTSKGLRVSKLFPVPETEHAALALLQGQARAEGEVPAEEFSDEHGEGRDVE